MTSSARARIDAHREAERLGGLRLTTRSKVVGCWTGRSARPGVFEILPT